MRAHYLQHVPFEGLGSIESWLRNADYEISSTQFFNSQVLPEVMDIDFLIVMGGPMSVNDEMEFPWLVEEKKFIRDVIDAGKSVLGVCLGAQLIANAMGGKVFRSSVKEIGWFPIQAVNSAIDSVFHFPQEAQVFHWHGETFSLPKDAVLIAKSKGCINQAFQIRNNVIGLQFHLEATPISAQVMIDHCSDELIKGQFIQTDTEILSTDKGRYSSINSLMECVLEYLHSSHG